MKRSTSNFEDQYYENKKMKNETEEIPNSNYYVIRKAKSTFDIKNNELMNDVSSHKNKAGQKSNSPSSNRRNRKNRYRPFNLKNRLETNESKSTFNASTSNPSLNNRSSNLLEKKQDDEKLNIFTDTNTESISGYVIRNSISLDRTLTATKTIADEVKELRKKFYDLVKSKNLTFESEFSGKLKFKDFTAEFRFVDSIEKLEWNLLNCAIKNLDKQTVTDELMVEETNESDSIIEEIKMVLAKQDNRLLFKDEMSTEYQRTFKKKIDHTWFEKVNDNPCFELKRVGAGNLITIRLL